jgi:serine/threonine protein kinase
MKSELKQISHQLSNTRKPEDIFGQTKGQDENYLPNVKMNYHALVKLVHPDLYQSKEEQVFAEAVISQLNEWFKIAEQKIMAGRYGQEDDPQKKIVIQTKKRTYFVTDKYSSNGVFNFYPCIFEENQQTHQAVIQLVQNTDNNDLLQNEINVLRHLQKDTMVKSFSAYLPEIMDSFVYQDEDKAYQAVVFESHRKWYSLEAVRKAYPDGVDPKDMAWIWRRLLSVLGFVHRNEVIHSAVLPENVWLLPKQHGLMLRTWSYTVNDQTNSWKRILLNHPKYAIWYTPDISGQRTATPGTDIIFSAKCMLYLLGANPRDGFLSTDLPIPAALKNFFRGCVLPATRAPQDAWSLLREFDTLIEKLWGKRKFHPFKML